MNFAPSAEFPIKHPATAIALPSPVLPKMLQSLQESNNRSKSPTLLLKSIRFPFHPQEKPHAIKPPSIAAKQPAVHIPPNSPLQKVFALNNYAFAGSTTLITGINPKAFEKGGYPIRSVSAFTPSNPQQSPGREPRFSASANEGGEFRKLTFALNELSSSLNALQALGSLLRRIDRRIARCIRPALKSTLSSMSVPRAGDAHASNGRSASRPHPRSSNTHTTAPNLPPRLPK